MRRKSLKIKVGENLYIGGDSPISVQSMLNIPCNNIEGNVNQAKKLESLGCNIVRVAIPNVDAIKLIPKLKESVSVPIVADIHFDYRLAIESVNAGVDKIRINPGNIGDESRIKMVVNACKNKNIPIRIGVNSGSLEKLILSKYGAPTPQALCESAIYHVRLLEKFDFNSIVISLKSSNVNYMVESYKLIADKVDYPLHLGVTETGTERMGIVKSAIGIGALLLEGIGDTIRVSLTSDPVNEVSAAYDILKSLNMYNKGVKLIACPTCGRTRIDIINLSNLLEKQLKDCDKNITVAVMGCAVNGPGEAREADIGIAGGNKEGLIFKKGEILRKVPEKDLLYELMKEIEKM